VLQWDGSCCYIKLFSRPNLGHVEVAFEGWIDAFMNGGEPIIRRITKLDHSKNNAAPVKPKLQGIVPPLPPKPVPKEEYKPPYPELYHGLWDRWTIENWSEGATNEGKKFWVNHHSRELVWNLDEIPCKLVRCFFLVRGVPFEILETQPTELERFQDVWIKFFAKEVGLKT